MIRRAMYRMSESDTWIDLNVVVAVTARPGEPAQIPVGGVGFPHTPFGPDVTRHRVTVSLSSGREYTVYYDTLPMAFDAANHMVRTIKGEV